jgi:uncharacterized protein
VLAIPANYPTMNLAEIEKLIVQARPELEAMGAKHIALFGSRVRGDDKPESDLDVLVDVYEHRIFSLFDLIGLERVLSEKTGLQTQVTMKRHLPDDFKKHGQFRTRNLF